MESPLCELRPAAHMENRLTAPPPHPIYREWVSGGGAGLFSLALCTCFTHRRPVNPCLQIHTIAGLIRNAKVTGRQGWESIWLILTCTLREIQGPSLRGRLAVPFLFSFNEGSYEYNSGLLKGSN